MPDAPSVSPAMEALEAARAAWSRRFMQLELELEENDYEPVIGTCGRCGAYWDMSQHEVCPAPCGGYVG